MSDAEQLRKSLRDSLRGKRRELSAEQQADASQKILRVVRELDAFRAARRVAFYQSFDGELDPQPILDFALEAGKSCYLPAVTEENPEFISFAPFARGTELTRSNLGVEEPPAADTISPTDLDLVFVPLVAFDDRCFRLGLGRGFYDRTFSFKIFNRRSQPLLLGLAHECQHTEQFTVQSWDVRLDAVITAEKIYRPESD
jgi:5-formyltetrahydrofolate cyclo-ligase